MNIKLFVATVAATTLTTVPVLAQSSAWAYMGQASSGESIYVNRHSIVYQEQNQVDFVYKVDDEVIAGTAYCQENRWYASESGTFSPSSQATQSMINYVCEREFSMN